MTHPDTGLLAGCTPWPPSVAAAYREAGYWTGTTLGRTLRESAERFPARTAVVDGDRRWTYRELDDEADGLAYGLAGMAIQPGERVVVQLPNIGEFVTVLFALLRLGAIPVLAQPAHRAHEITHLCTVSDATVYIVPDEQWGFDYRVLARQVREKCPALRHIVVAGDAQELVPLETLRVAAERLPERDAGEVALFQLSGGTTAAPKLIPRTHDDYGYSVRASVRLCQLTPESVYLCVLPAAHNFPLSSPGVLGALYAGATVVMAPSPSADVAFSLIERERATITAVVPPVALLWLDAASTTRSDLSTLDVLQVGGAAFKPAAAQCVRDTLRCRLQQVFGMAEGLVNYTRLDDPEEVVTATQGRPLSPADEIRIVDDSDRDVPPGDAGQLLTRGPYTIRGYYRADEHNAIAFTPDGFYRTGDIVRQAPSGNLVVEGRAKDLINRGGDKVSAEEIENHLLAHPDVHDAAVVAMPDDLMGERSCAFIVPRSTPPKAKALRMFLHEREVAAYKVPDRFEFVPSFPETSVGKTSKKELRRLVAERLGAERPRDGGPGEPASDQQARLKEKTLDERTG